MASDISESRPQSRSQPSAGERAWLAAGLDQQQGKLPMFDADGQRIDPQIIQSCLDRGWCEPWLSFPGAPDWRPLRLTDAGMAALYGASSG